MPQHTNPSGPEPPVDTAPAAQLLSNGRYTTLVTAAGAGYSAFGDFALTRWAADRTRDADGFFLYVRDVESGAYWGAGRQPVHRPPGRYAARFGPGRAELAREDDGVETVVELCVAPDDDVELRRYTLTNRGSRPRRLEVTTYAECVLNVPAADASHPAFSKLFVQTEYLPARQLLLARRRLRSPGDAPLWLAHQLWREGPASAAGDVECETDRARFIGRGRTLAGPRAMDAGARLSGTVGNVLDPVLSFRRTLDLAPGATARLVAVLGAAYSRETVEAAMARYAGDGGAMRAVDDAFERAASRARRVMAEAGVPAEHVEWLPRITGALAYGHPGLPLRAGEAWRIAADDRTLLETVARMLEAGELTAVVTDGGRHHTDAGDDRPRADAGDDRAGSNAGGHPPTVAAGAPGVSHGGASEPASGAGEEALRFFNGYGGFTGDGTEYVIRLAAGPAGPRRPPLPWTNVVANERVGFLATESGAGYTWSVNSRENRLTPWSNDPVTDPHGEALYLRDEESGAFWSPTPGPAPGAGAYEVRHGFGYTSYHHTSRELEQEVTCFVPRHDPVKVVQLRVTNRGPRARRLSATAYAEWVLGSLPQGSGRFVATAHDEESGAILAVNEANGEFAHLVAFAAAVAPDGARAEMTADRAAFLGPHGSAASPAALRSAAPLDGRTGAGLDPCAAFRLALDVAPGETVECAFLLGQADDRAGVRALVGRCREPGAVARAVDEVREFWRDTLSGVQVATPSPGIDLMVNGWLAYQNLSCRVWGRSAFYQSGGAFGFRDQLQDAAALVYLMPELTRRQIVLHAAHQFVEGDVLHWWHPPLSKGIRTRFSDDLLWLPYVATFYVETTGDASVLDEPARFVTARPLQPGEDEAFLVPHDSGEQASVYEHCCRALDRSLTAGAHGLPLMGTGDWNDGMNRVGREGRGESVWLGFFLHDILTSFIPVCERRGDAARAERYRAYQTRLAAALNDGGWDGGWYRRAYYDDGAPLGAAESDECRIDAIAQAWAVLSGAAPRERAAQALDAMERHLVDEEAGIIRLLTPAFDRTPHDPGYIKGYLPGVRENGGQYTHGALWAVRALAEFGRSERAARLFEMLSPVEHARTPEEVATYQVEPYVVAADVYGVEPHVGRGGWTWYTGSAGWMFRVALESILGVTVAGGTALELRPCIPEAWPGFTVRYRLPDRRTVYEIEVRRPEGGDVSGTAVRTEDGEGGDVRVEGGAVVIPLREDGAVHRVQVTLGGGDVTPRYASRAEVGVGW